ncbi:MAG: hypothetical protein WC359_12355 [Dehalococcoidia bacterium]|jgi:hypothetical protein
MITLHLNKVRKFVVGEIVHLKVKSIYEHAPGKWRLLAEDVTPLPGAEPTGYACGFCGIIEEAKEDGSLPDGWVEVKYQEGSSFRCSACSGFPTCRVCGCTDANACEGGCYWVKPDLCSACEDKEYRK